jgi:aryl-alcohol dehydrogenase-like predicted oxidoreductase
MRVDRDMDRTALGASGLEVSRLSLGSWRTFERIGGERGLAVMRAAREHGVNFLDDARYNDETGSAPIPTGYSEVLFGELFREAGWDRKDTVVSNKLWWEFWPEQNARKELDGSLERMGFEYVDVIYANPPPDGLPVGDMVAAVTELIEAGKARAWAIVNWDAAPLLEASQAARELGAPQPCAAQLPYSFAHRDWVESEAMSAALEASGAGVVASFTLAGGLLTGKYETGASGRHAADIADPSLDERRRAGGRLRALASDVGISPAVLAIAFALRNPAVASVLFGSTSPEQIEENVRALDVSDEVAERVAALQ